MTTDAERQRPVQAPWPLAAAITAGGQSRRFGQDKALYPVGGVPLLLRVAASMSTLTPRLLIAPAGRYSLPGWQTTPDLRPGEGPLAGLETALSTLAGRFPAGAWLAFAAVDLPNLTPAYWALLAGRTGQAGGRQAVVGLDTRQRSQPLAALYHSSVLPQVTALLDEGERRMSALLDQLDGSALDWSALDWRETESVCPGAYVNLNSLPDDSAEASGS